ncbi:50S ribosomal protein L6 [bacterium]|nr:50S ribosomal protein L6 [bacterium]
MSRIGKMPIHIAEGVDVQIDGDLIKISGHKGALKHKLDAEVSAVVEDNKIIVKRSSDTKSARAKHGLNRALISNIVTGVTTGFEKILEIKGVGYRAQLQGRKLQLQLGFSHPMIYEIPSNIEIEVMKNNQIVVKGIDKQLVGEVAVTIRNMKKPEPYKGKGIRYLGEHIKHKVGKTATTGVQA